MTRSRDTIVERQVREWIARRRARAGHRLAEEAKPVVTITGEYGSLADSVGEALAERLGWTLYDRELVTLIAERASVARSRVEAAEAGDRTYLGDLLDLMLSSDTMSSADYLTSLTDVVEYIASEGQAVILGRAANVVLGPERALRVRCVAPLPLRVRRLAHHRDIPIEEAAREVERTDARRTRMVKALFGVDPRDPIGYDLVLSTERLGVPQAVAVVEAALRERWPR